MASDADKTNETGFWAAARAVLQSVRESANAAIEPVSEPLMRDGTLAAAFRQGVEELWQGLKAFPDTIQAHEPGTLFSPTQGEIADARKPEAALSLTEILALNTPQTPSQEKENDQGLER